MKLHDKQGLIDCSAGVILEGRPESKVRLYAV